MQEEISVSKVSKSRILRNPESFVLKMKMTAKNDPQLGLPSWRNGEESTCQCRRHETWVPSLGQEDPPEEGMATHSSVLA